LTEIGAARRTSVAADSTRVWIATESGAFRLRSDTGMWKRFWTTDGIIDDLVQAVCLEGEYVWFGTRRGASRYHLASDFFERDPD
jgi:ligand-binding sensor domain-containing protein